ncbi:MAG: hypothetical protein MUC87_13700 [Bacteroidia bacterium]|jgi:hypothetical protein|nr:hypothetical protein [Bacteroidia bacterium]
MHFILPGDICVQTTRTMLLSALILAFVCLAILALAFLPYEVKVEDYTDVAGMETDCPVLRDTLVQPGATAAA